MPSQLRALPIACAILCASISNSNSAATIGLYTDESATMCSFAGNAPGLVTAYVVIKPDASGVKSLQFAAPVPACMGAAVAPAPAVLTLGRNYPNPFNPQTLIPYGVPDANGTTHVRLAIYDSTGRLIRALVDDAQTAGTRNVLWRGDDQSGRPVTSGVYFCVLDSGGERRTQKMVLLK